jgi:tRNA pseudouridine32 synthase/23S rRNA pseudouridine746 synthase
MYSQGSKWGDHCTIQRWVEQQTQQPAFVVHRLDRAATGLIIIAHQKKVAAQLAALFADRAIDKRYHATVLGVFPDTPITITTPIENRAAVSHLTKIAFNPLTQQSIVEVAIETGRKHQIRRHLSGHGYPIVGDRLYGPDNQQDSASNLQLCCVYLAFRCPLSATQKTYQLDSALHSS